MHGIVVNGTCGEWFVQDRDERQAVAETAVSAAAGRMTVLVGCTDYRADLVIDLARHALAAGADGVLASPPPYAKLFPNEIIAYYQDIYGRCRRPARGLQLAARQWCRHRSRPR